MPIAGEIVTETFKYDDGRGRAPRGHETLRLHGYCLRSLQNDLPHMSGFSSGEFPLMVAWAFRK